MVVLYILFALVLLLLFRSIIAAIYNHKFYVKIVGMDSIKFSKFQIGLVSMRLKKMENPKDYNETWALYLGRKSIVLTILPKRIEVDENLDVVRKG